MTTILKKNKKKRGHVNVGHRCIGKHMKHSSGRGNVGGMHHHHILFNKYHPGYFRKVGMRNFHKLRNHYHCPIINIEKLWYFPPEDAKAKATADSAPLIDVTQFRFFKVFGKAELPSQPIVLKDRIISNMAEKKIKEAGQGVMLIA